MGRFGSSGFPGAGARVPSAELLDDDALLRLPLEVRIQPGSTKSIALLLLLLMVVLAAIAILVTGSVTRGGMALELSVASWRTALLFALIPLRGFFPGDPPLGRGWTSSSPSGSSAGQAGSAGHPGHAGAGGPAVGASHGPGLS